MKCTLLSVFALAASLCGAYPTLPAFDNAKTRIRDPFVLTDAKNGCYYLYQSKRISPTSCGVYAFRSNDLKNWTKGVVVMEAPKEWGNAAVWAAEVYARDGAYWMTATITTDPDPTNPIVEHWLNGAAPEPPERMPKLQPRGTWIFRSDSPTGLFRPWSKGPVTPPEWMCIDGTLVDHEGHPYMVYCREWVQFGIGCIDCVRLSDDLREAAGKPVPLFRSQTDFCANVSSSRVTDGPFCWRSEKSGKLYMIWSSFRFPPRNDRWADYNVILCESTTGSPLGPWKCVKCLYQNGGHGMIFRDLAGRPKLLVHGPNAGPNERVRFFDLIDDGESLSLDVDLKTRLDCAQFADWRCVPATAPAHVPTGCPDFDVALPQTNDALVVRAADFGFSQANDDNAAAVNRALASVPSEKAVRLVLAPGTYRCFGENGIRLQNRKDLTLDGCGAKLVFRRPSHRVTGAVRWQQEDDAANIVVRGCERTEVRNLSMDWDWDHDPLGFLATCEARHVETNRDNESYIDLRMIAPSRHPSYPNPVPIQILTARQDARNVCLANVRGLHAYFGLAQGHFGTKNEWIAPDTLRVWPYVKQSGVFQTPEFDGVFKPGANRAFVESLEVGRTLAAAHYYYGMNGFVLDSNHDLTIRNIAIESCRGLGFEVRGTQRSWQLVNVKIAPPADAPYPREITCTADAFHIARSCGRCKFVNCSWKLHEDDSINSHDRTTLARKSGPRWLQVVNTRGTAYFGAAVGDEIELREEDFAPTGWRGKITAVEKDGYVFDRDVPKSKGLFFVLFNRSYGTDDILIKGCRFRNTPWARDLILASNVTIEDCAFENIAGTPLRFQACYTHNVWCEGTGATNIVVRNCRFRNVADNYLVGEASSQIYSGVRVPFRSDTPERHVPIADEALRRAVAEREAAGLKVAPWLGLVSDILVENCSFVNPRGFVWHILNGGEMTFRNNTIELDDDAPYPYLPYAGSLYAERAGSVHCSNNVFRAKSPRTAGVYSTVALDESHVREAKPVLGYQLDISRCKVPTMATLYRIVDILADLGYNQFQLYTEHTFAYPQHETVWREASPMTPDEIRALDDYCAKKGVELVPNQNSFGHLEHWLKHPEYNGLADHPHGGARVKSWGSYVSPFATALNPTDPRCIDFIGGLYDALLPCFKSKYVNVGCDETVELEDADFAGRSAAAVREKGPARVYFEYLMKIHRLVRERGHEMMFWGDIILKHPELVAELPEDAICLDWGYEFDHPFESQAKVFEEANRKFILCPGTSAWGSLFGRKVNAFMNIDNALKAGRAHGAMGYMLADWGDGGHPNPWIVSLPAIVYLAHRSRGEDITFDGVIAEIDRICGGRCGAALLAYGDVCQKWKGRHRNGSEPYAVLIDGAKYHPARGVTDQTVQDGLAQIKAAQAMLDLNGAADWAKEDFEMLALFGRALELKVRNPKMKNFRATFESEYRRLWLRQNRVGGLNDSLFWIFGR